MFAPALRGGEASVDQFVVAIVSEQVDHPWPQVKHPPGRPALQRGEFAVLQLLQDPHLVVQSPSSPEVFWAQHHNGIFRSTNDMESWHEIEKAGPSTFGFAVAVDPKDANTAWFVPAIKDEKRIPVEGKLVVTRTRDGGKTFDVLTKGLPDQFAYDLVFRHSLAVAPDGTLAMGSTTGNLYTSHDAGDSWTCISHHLPPIHAVAFVS